ncbi:MAG TPA: PKD domain-containing protein [Clostridia bacterium]|nr:PKD domain-containing protein [Clostridia bacterium]
MKKSIVFLMILIIVITSLPFKVNALQIGYYPNVDTIGYDCVVTKAKTSTKYKIMGFTVKCITNGKSYITTLMLEPFDDIDNRDGTTVTVPIRIPARNGPNSVKQRFIDKYGASDDFIELFSRKATLYFDGIMTIIENGEPLADMQSNGTVVKHGTSTPAVLGKDYFTTNAIKDVRNWREKSDLDKFFGLSVSIPPKPQDNLKTPDAHISKGSTNVDDSTISYLDNEEINLSGNNSWFPNYADGKVYKWEYKPISSLSWSFISQGEGISYPSFPKFAVGKYNVKLTVWYRVGEITYTNMTDTAQVTLNITQSPQGAYVIAEPSTDGDKMITQSQINSNATINVTVTVKGTLRNYTDTSKITQWKNNLRKDPSGTGDQFQAFTYTSGLGLSQTSQKTFTLQAGVLKSADSYTQKFAVSSFATVNGQQLKSNTEYCAVTLYKGTQPPPQTNNKPPVAVISAPSTAKLGEDVFITGTASYDPDGTVERYLWGIAGPDVTPETSYTTVTYPKTGNFNIFLAVYDNNGAQGAAQRTITIVPPTPEAHFTVAGTQKEMRIITLTNTSTSPARYPIATTKNVWTVSPVSGSGAAANAIYKITNKSTVKEQLTGDPYTAASLNGLNTPMITFTKAGQYDITLTVTNSAGYSNSTTQRITVQPDIPPVSKFRTETKIYRETIVDGVNYAKITVNDESYSPDGDYISYRKIWAVYDANNNGIFGDSGDQTVVISETSDRHVIDTVKAYEYLTREVGKYDVHVTVKESYIP